MRLWLQPITVGEARVFWTMRHGFRTARSIAAEVSRRPRTVQGHLNRLVRKDRIEIIGTLSRHRCYSWKEVTYMAKPKKPSKPKPKPEPQPNY